MDKKIKNMTNLVSKIIDYMMHRHVLCVFQRLFFILSRFLNSVNSFLCFRVLKPVLKKLLNHPSNSREIESVMSVISDLPCGCVPQSIGAFRTKRRQGKKLTFHT